jgi:hypothetical protein
VGRERGRLQLKTGRLALPLPARIQRSDLIPLTRERPRKSVDKSGVEFRLESRWVEKEPPLPARVRRWGAHDLVRGVDNMVKLRRVSWQAGGACSPESEARISDSDRLNEGSLEGVSPAQREALYGTTRPFRLVFFKEFSLVGPIAFRSLLDC